MQPARDNLDITARVGLDRGAEPGGLEPAIVVAGHRGALGVQAEEPERGLGVVRRHLLRGGDDCEMR